MKAPVFARPPNVISFTSRYDFERQLERAGVSLQEWEEEKREKLWKEIGEHDAVYYLRDNPFLNSSIQQPVRFVLAVSVRIQLEHPQHGPMVLIEYARNHDVWFPRRHESSSVSEKIHLHPNGIRAETLQETILRCYTAELGLHTISSEEMSDEWLRFWPNKQSTEEPQYAVMDSVLVGGKYVEKEFKSGRGYKYYPLPTHIQVAHYLHTLPSHHYWDGWRKDEDTRYSSRWIRRGESRGLDPIPAGKLDEALA